MIILVIYLIFSTQEKFQAQLKAKFVNGVCEEGKTYNEYENKTKCENRFVCDSEFGRCKQQAAPKEIKDSTGKIIDFSYPDYSKCEKGCRFTPRQGIKNPLRCDVVPHLIDPKLYVNELEKNEIEREYGNSKELSNPTDMVVSDDGSLKSIVLKQYARKDDCENRYRCNQSLGICEQTAGGEYTLERNCNKNCRIKTSDRQINKLLIHFSRDLSKFKDEDQKLIVDSLIKKIKTRIPNFEDLIRDKDEDESESDSLPLYGSKCEFNSDKQCKLFPKKYSVEFIFKSDVIYDVIFENFRILFKSPLQFTVNIGRKNELFEADYIYIEYDGKSPLCEKISSDKFENFQDYTLLEILDTKDNYELKKMIWNEVDQTDIQNYNKDIFNFKYEKSSIELPKIVHMSAVEIDDPNKKLENHYKNNIPSISGFKFEIYNLDDQLLDNFKHKIYLDNDMINIAKKQYTDLKFLKIGIEDPNKVFDKLHEVLFLLYRTHDYRYYYKQLEVELDKYTKFKYGLKKKHNPTPSESEIKDYENSLNYIKTEIDNPESDANNREKLLINLYSNNLGFKLKLNIFKDEFLTDIITYEEEPLTKSEADKCSFIPKGETIFGCKQLCLNGIPENKCLENECKKLCDTCETLECKWNIFEYRENSGFLPNPAKIKAFSGNKSIKITWIEPFSKFKINKYYIILSNNSNEVLEIYVYNSVNSINEYIIKNLENGRVYNINIICKNKYGVSESSNIESVIPQAINVFDKQTDINYSKYNDSIESYIKSKALDGVSSNDTEFVSYDQYKQKIELYERAIILNDLKKVLGDKLGKGIKYNIYNVNIF